MPPLLAILAERRLRADTVGQPQPPVPVQPPVQPPAPVPAPPPVVVPAAPLRAVGTLQAVPNGPAAPTTRKAPLTVCACRWAVGVHCEALLRAAPDISSAVGRHVMNGGNDIGCPGRRLT